MMHLFFTMGFQRSGTTLLNYLINEHPQVVSYSEWELAYWAYTGNEKLLVDSMADSYLKAQEDIPFDPERYAQYSWGYLKGELSLPEFIAQSYKLGCGPDTLAYGNKEAISLTHCRHGFFKKFVKDFKGKSRLIMLERDPRAVTASFMKLGFFPPNKAPLTQHHMQQFVRDYIRCMNTTMRILSSFAFLPIKYEKLMAQPQKTLHTIFTFLEVNTDPALIDAICTKHNQSSRLQFSGFVPERVLGWKNILTEEDAIWIKREYDKNRTPVALA